MTEGSASQDNGLALLQHRLGYSFQNLDILERALTHSSFAHEYRAVSEDSSVRDYEALEFLGDSMLGFLLSERLFASYPFANEGKLSKIRSFLVSTKHLASLSEELGLGAFLKLGRGEEKTGGRRKRGLLADLFESVVAAIYLDGGLQPARRFVLGQFEPLLANIQEKRLNFRDHKSLLQEELHARGLSEPTYSVVREEGPAHQRKFVVEVYGDGKFLAKAAGQSKKDAQQRAARLALGRLAHLLPDP